MTTKVFSEEVNYEKLNSMKPEYQYHRQPQMTGGDTVNLSTTGGEESVFEIPARVLNPSHSLLTFNLAVQAQADEYVALIAAGGCAAIRDLEIYTKDGTRLVDVKNVGKMCEVMSVTDTPLEAFLTHDAATGFSKSNEPSGHDSYTSFEIISEGRATGSNTVGFVAATGRLTFAIGATPDVDIFDCQVDLRLGDTIVFNAGDLADRSLIVTRIVSDRIVVVTGGGDVGDHAPTVISTNTFTIYKKRGGALRHGYRNCVPTAFDADLDFARDVNSIPYTEPISYTTSGAINAGLTIKYRLSLSKLKNTLCELDKDLYFGQIIYMRIVWNSTNVIARAGDDNKLTNQVPITPDPDDIALSNLRFYIAYEKNVNLANEVKNKTMDEGMNILIDYLHCYNQNLISTDHSLSYKFGRAHGRRLKRIYAVPYVASSTTGTNHYNHHYNQLNEAIVEIYTLVDGERQQQWNLNSANGDEYLVMKDRLDGSCIQSLDQFQSHYFFIDSFDNMKFIERAPNMACGRRLDVEIKWDLQAITTGPRNWYVFAVVQRMLMINRDEIRLD